jgi:hypothetical protein
MRDSDIDTLTADGAQDGANTTNEAAERLLEWIAADGFAPSYARARAGSPEARKRLAAALTAERAAGRVEATVGMLDAQQQVADATRRATVERIREQLASWDGLPSGLDAILDEEAAR